jgi:hypothetical protein
MPPRLCPRITYPVTKNRVSGEPDNLRRPTLSPVLGRPHGTKVLVEPSSAVPFAALLEHRPARTVVPTGPLHHVLLVDLDAIAALTE